MGVTLKHVADAVGVDPSVVSRVLNNSSGSTRVSIRRAQDIRQAARRLGYRVNAAAQAMSRGRFHAVGLMFPKTDHAGALPGGIQSTIQEELDRHDLHMIIGRASDQELTSRKDLPRLLREWAVDGLLISYVIDMPSLMKDLIQQYALPAIYINVDESADCVRPDDYGIFRQTTESLLAMGHRRILYGGADTKAGARHYSVAARRKGYLDAMAAAGLPPQLLQGIASGPYADAQAIRASLAEAHRPSAVITIGSPVEFVLAAMEQGLRLPEDLSLVMMTDPALEASGGLIRRFGSLQVDAMVLPVYTIGRTAVRMLLDKIQTPKKDLPTQIIPFTYERGNSTQPPTDG